MPKNYKKSEEDIVSLVLELAGDLVSEADFCKLIVQQQTIASSDPIAAGKIQETMNARFYAFLRDKKLPSDFVNQLKIVVPLISMKMNDELKEIDSDESKDFVIGKLKQYPGFYGGQ